MKELRRKEEAFFGLARALREELSVVPVLYGSLGLALATGEEIAVNDVDLLVPAAFLGARWGELLAFMRARRFVLKNKHEHEFRKGSLVVAFAGTGVLRDIYAAPRDIPLRRMRGVAFRLPTLRQFLATYRFSLKDGYRVAKRTDRAKIRLLEKHL